MKAKNINGYFQIIDYDYEISQVESTYKNLIIQNSVDDDTINSILLKSEENRTMSDLKKIIERKKIDDWFDKKKSEFNGYKDLIVVPYEGKIEEYETRKEVPSINWFTFGKYKVTYTAIHKNGVIKQTKSIIVTINPANTQINGTSTITVSKRNSKFRND